ncbi:MAG: low molecular weight phosphatase family protein [Candidatus Woesearchaeota archaeon]
MNILFVCKYNRYRSRIAEAYFKKVNKDNKIRVKSAGLTPGRNLTMEVISAAKQNGLKLRGKPKPASQRLLEWADKIIIVADNIPPQIFGEERLEGKEVIQLHINDLPKNSLEQRIEHIKVICSKIDELMKSMKEN